MTILKPKKLPQACLIWLHGLGANKQDMEALAQSLSLSESEILLKHIFLNAPIRPVSLNGGASMRAWYDIPADFSLNREDKAGITSTTHAIHAVIDAQLAADIPANRIGLVGFSQGGATALYAGMQYPQPLGGIAALSGYLPLHKTQFPESQKNTPIFLGAGELDPVVHYAWTQTSCLHLQKLGYSKISWHSYPMEHSVCHEETQDLTIWIKKSFK